MRVFYRVQMYWLADLLEFPKVNAVRSLFN